MQFFKQRQPLSLILVLTLLLTVSWLPYLQVLAPHLSYGDEGYVVQGAWRLFQGEMPFRDFFSGMPGAYYWTALFMQLFGPTFLAVRIGVLTLAALIFLLLGLVARRLGLRAPLGYLVLAAFALQFGGPYWFIASHHWLGLALTLASLLCLLPATDTVAPPAPRTLLAGIFAAAATLTMQHLGGLWILCAGAAILGFPRPVRGQIFLRFFGGIFLTAVPIALWYGLGAGFDTLYYNLVVFPLTRYYNIQEHAGINVAYFNQIFDMLTALTQGRDSLLSWVQLAAVASLTAGVLVINVLPFCGLAGLIYLWKNRGAALQRSTLLLLTAFFCAQYLKVLFRVMDHTLVFAAPASILVILVAIDQLRQRQRGATGIRLFNGIWFTLFLGVGIATLGFHLLAPRKVTMTPAGAVYSVTPPDHQTLQYLTGFFAARKAANETVYCYPYAPMLYFLFQAQNPTRYDTLVFPMATDAQRADSVRQLEAHDNGWVILTTEVDGDPMLNYLWRNYQFQTKLPLALVLKKRTAANPATAPETSR